ncbi:type II toxin-antitoxin system HipA family toxin [Chitinimonas arctica]|uniref:Type II toxin-antitoxin system HipA family toxin n=1 Tax=Chitinimonas arctica TaxID=2594795 RepID=A0A516SK97_9NEIS|nr:type II toxin-antitoxin system HipA family toxin [Chitinimonas arctica]QDQ28576.1 type II toxin-antitoxin system HipA family toxin [Chitinimonas arctica]
MSYVPQNLVYVYYHGLEGEILVGRLLRKGRKLYFEYDVDFLRLGLELSPFKLPLKSGVILPNDWTFEGLFGVFNDSLPDGWGRLLLDRKLMGLGINPGDLSPLDRLCFVGSNGMGALSYQPENTSSFTPLLSDLDEIDHEIQNYQAQEDGSYVDDLLALGGSSSGARPKILLHIDKDEWLVKFRSSLDPKDIGAIEYAYHLMAIDAGLNVPEAKFFPSRKGGGFFGVKRFDREGRRRIHMHTIAGLLHADHREPSLDYEAVMKVSKYLTRDSRECEVQFRNAVFNVLSHNRDDHSKNFSFLMTGNGTWSVSPAYDLTFSSGPSGEHTTMVMGAGKYPKREHLLKLAAVGGIKNDKALEITDQVFSAVKKWKVFARDTDVSKLQATRIAETLDLIAKDILN